MARTSPFLLGGCGNALPLGASVGKLFSIKEGTDLTHKRKQAIVDFFLWFDCLFVVLIFNSVHKWVTFLVQDYIEPDVPCTPTVSSSRRHHPACHQRRKLHRWSLRIFQPGNSKKGGRDKKASAGTKAYSQPTRKCFLEPPSGYLC